MENPNRVFEENIMAILDSSGVKEARDVHDDRLSFLESVRAASLFPDSVPPPSWIILDAILEIMRSSDSLELAMASYHLLNDLDKRYPRVYLVNSDHPQSSSSASSGGVGNLVVATEAWSPFALGAEAPHGDGNGIRRNSDSLIDSGSFSILIEDIAQSVNIMNFQMLMKTVEDMLLFQYLVNVIKADFLPRQNLYKETLNWVLIRESVLNMLLGSRKLNFKSFVKNCLLIISEKWHHDISLQDQKNDEYFTAKIGQDCDVGLAIAVNELEKEICVTVQKLFTLIAELDLIRKEADLLGSTSRVDGLRTPLLEIILDELAYNTDQISSFLMVFVEPKWKMEIILQYFSKYSMKPCIHTRRTTESSNASTFEDVLSYFSTPASTKSIVRKVTSEVAQLLLAHAFQAYLSLQHDPKRIANFSEKIGDITLPQICSGLIYSFQNLKKIDEYVYYFVVVLVLQFCLC